MQGDLFEAEREQRTLEAKTKSKPSSEGIEGRALLPFVIQSDEEAASVTGRAGLPLLVKAPRGYRGDDLVRKHLKPKKREARLLRASPE